MLRHKAKATVVTTAAVALMLAGCSSSNNPDDEPPMDDVNAATSALTTAPPLTYAPELDTDAQDPESVATRAFELLYSWDFANDYDPRDAVERARPLMSVAAYQQLAMFQPPPIVNYRLWDDWKALGAQTEAHVSVASEQHPPDTGSSWSRKIHVRVIVTDRDGAVLMNRAVIAPTILVKQAGQWLVESTKIEELPS